MDVFNYKLLVIRQVENDIELQYAFALNKDIDEKSWIIGFDKSFLEEASDFKGDLFRFVYRASRDDRIHIVKRFGRKTNDIDYAIIYVVMEVIEFYKTNHEILTQIYKIDKEVYEKVMKEE